MASNGINAKKLPVGIEDFAKLKQLDYYYVDKTDLIKTMLDNLGEVNLFTRPRRFGKSLTMSMLKSFFEIGTDPTLFDGLKISSEADLCRDYLGQYPVISITLKEVKGLSFEEAKKQLGISISIEANRLSRRLDMDRLNPDDRDILNGFKTGKGDMPSVLAQLSRILCEYYDKKVIILIDEYDVPLQKAEQNGYYKEMAALVSQLFGYGMKTNNCMMFAVVTGCLRISKESIFTGFNNPKIYTIVDERFDEWFGFTDAEVRQMLADYGMDEYYDLTKEWYDGYLFGNTKVYCPWDVINWCDQLANTSDRRPKNFWANTSGNDMVLRFVEMADETTRFELEDLSDGKSIDKDIHMELTYAELDKNIDNLWSILFMTGYLTQCGQNEDGSFRLVIPNREIRDIFSRQIKDWFFEKIEGGLTDLYQAFDNADAEKIQSRLNDCLGESISFMDGGNTDAQKETFYHGLLLGILKCRRSWRVKSNREAGNGRADIVLVDRFHHCGHIIEVKYAATAAKLDDMALAALDQIGDRDYDDYFQDFDIDVVNHFGISFFRKKCRVKSGAKPGEVTIHSHFPSHSQK